MTHWNLQSLQMRLVCNTKRICCLCLMICILPFYACHKEETISNGEWIANIAELAGIQDYAQQEPYFTNVPKEHRYFSSFQANVEWGIIHVEDKIDVEGALTKAFAAYTLMNLLDETKTTDIQIHDVHNHKYQKQIEYAVAINLFTLDNNKNFYPEEKMSQTAALAALDEIVKHINTRTFQETKTNIIFKNGVQVHEIHPIDFDAENMKVHLQDTTPYDNESIVFFNNQYYEVENQEGQILKVKEIDITKYTESIDLQGSTDIQFSNAEIVDGNDEIIQEISASNHLENVSTHAKQKTFQVGEFTIVVNASSSNLKAEVSKELLYGSKMYALLQVKGIHCDYQWYSKQEEVQSAYFKVNLHASEKAGFKNGIYKNVYGDFSKVDPSNFVSTLQNLFQEKNDVIEKTLTICQVKVPIPNAPLMYLTMNLDLHFHMSGKVELTFTQDASIGFEVKEGKTRFIHEMKHSQSNQIKATTQLSCAIACALEMVKFRLLDISLHAGCNASYKTSFHLYQQENKQVVEADIPLDVSDSLAMDHPDILVCGDANAYFILYLKANSAKSQLGKWGLQKRFDLYKQSLFPKGYTHIENFQIVEKCTRKQRIQKVEHDSLKVSKKIRLDKYSYIVKLSNPVQIEITGLPQGYTKEDLQFISSDSNIVYVNENGVVEGKEKGSAIVTIQTRDGKEKIECNVLVSGG